MYVFLCNYLAALLLSAVNNVFTCAISRRTALIRAVFSSCPVDAWRRRLRPSCLRSRRRLESSSAESSLSSVNFAIIVIVSIG